MVSRTATTIIPYTELEVATGNFDSKRVAIDRVIIHTMDGTWQGAAARFDDPASKVSAHYGIKLDGSLIHWLEEFNVAYHAGDYPMNQRSIGIEHEDGGDYNGTRPDTLYETSAKLVKDICNFYNIPIDRQHILKHSEVSDAPTGCPDALDIDRIVRTAQGNTSTPTTNTNGADMYGGLDLNNKDSMKVCVDTFNKVQAGEYIDVNKYNADLKTKDDTIEGLNSTISQDNTTIKNNKTTIDGLNTQVKTLTSNLAQLQTQTDNNTTLQAQIDQLQTDKKNLKAENQTLVNSNAQLKRTSYTTTSSQTLFGELVDRVIKKIMPNK